VPRLIHGINRGTLFYQPDGYPGRLFIALIITIWLRTIRRIVDKLDLIMPTRVLLVGRGLFRDGLERTLAHEPTITVVGSADTWREAQVLVAQLKPDVLIVDHAATALRQADMTPVLGTEAQALKVIHLTLAENKMVVYDQRQVTDVSLIDLLSALDSTS
jgi:hypothetical protein